MSKTRPICDVYISYGPLEARLASDVARILQSLDLAVFDANAIPRDKHQEDAVWEAMAESEAFVVVVSEAAPSASTDRKSVV